MPCVTLTFELCISVKVILWRGIKNGKYLQKSILGRNCNQLEKSISSAERENKITRFLS